MAHTWEQHFDAMYDALSMIGWCDSPGGEEHARVKAEAIRFGRPEGDELARFIQDQANAVPSTE